MKKPQLEEVFFSDNNLTKQKLIIQLLKKEDCLYHQRFKECNHLFNKKNISNVHPHPPKE